MGRAAGAIGGVDRLLDVGSLEPSPGERSANTTVVPRSIREAIGGSATVCRPGPTPLPRMFCARRSLNRWLGSCARDISRTSARTSSLDGTTPSARHVSRSSVAKLRQSGARSPKARAKHRCTAWSSWSGTSARRACSAGMGLLAICCAIASGVSPSNSGCAVSSSCTTMPSEKTSERRSTGSPLDCSGDM